MNTKTYNALVKQFLRFLEELPPEELEALETRAKRIDYILIGPKQPPRHPVSVEDLSRIAAKLKEVASQEEGERLVQGMNKEELTQLSRILDLPTQKSDTVDRVRERLLHSTIGFKLRSQAIHRNNP